MRRAVALAIAALLAFPGLAWADEEMEDNAAQTARALSLQALALLEQGRGHEAATEKLDLALAAQDKNGIDLRAIRAAHAALHEENAAAAERLLQDAFPGESSHVVGVTFRPGIGGAQLGAAVAGGTLLGLAALGLFRRRRDDRRYGSA